MLPSWCLPPPSVPSKMLPPCMPSDMSPFAELQAPVASSLAHCPDDSGSGDEVESSTTPTAGRNLVTAEGVR
ncbi:hypothetical protein GUJ93_ZPchr0002g25227 [Zizania palustris]|uniref:Uncharacterized protein n=1 Tax=Zizania palustris TaxID=103762 RepID=A0A8J5SC96_ZIZPA|nr:hypothetical protein GUJ93_ZPchr0002g25227 [Zizania palustris]